MRQGYQFSGWYTDDETLERKVVSSDIAPEEDMEIIANWEANTYFVHISNGYGGTLSDISATFDNAFLVDALVRTGYQFKGWCVESGLNTTTAKYGTSISSCNNIITSSSMLCANGSPSGAVSFNNLTELNDG